MYRNNSVRYFHGAGVAVLLVAAGVLGGCRRDAAPAPAVEAARGPAAAVMQLIHDLRRDDLEAYARHAVPPELHARLDAAWREDRSRWPLTELPLHSRLPGMLTTLAAPGAEKALLATYNRQFGGAHGELRSAAATIGQFAVQYVQREGDYSEEERDHYTQLVGALSGWGRRAPLGDAKLAKKAIPQLVGAARLTGLADLPGASGPSRQGQLGMERSLRRLGPFFARVKRVLHSYGLDLNAALDSARVELAEQTGDTARVRLRYTVAGRDIDAYVRVQRLQGQWYLTDAVRHAEVQAAQAADGSAAATLPTRRAG